MSTQKGTNRERTILPSKQGRRRRQPLILEEDGRNPGVLDASDERDSPHRTGIRESLPVVMIYLPGIHFFSFFLCVFTETPLANYFKRRIARSGKGATTRKKSWFSVIS